MMENIKKVQLTKMVTGFGLLGHLAEMVNGSGCSVRIFSGQVPVIPEAEEFAAMGLIPAGAHKNREFREQIITFAETVPRTLQDLLFDPQTSGGLLISVRDVQCSEAKRIMVMCATDRVGFGDDALGLKLMVNFLRTLKEIGNELWRLVFVNNGVKLTIEGSEVLEDLKAYESVGLKILVCGTCLDHFDILEKKQVGETTNMLDIVTAMQLADKVINL